ncbi:MAG: metal ABC transporter substrate-binding protein, partial [Intestinibacter sp.]|uniref:metal ABC transporter substrate-binding protein n=1 Tax=Intestinibacter sp. TaxID=1965304 RepID=UPI003F13FE03
MNKKKIGIVILIVAILFAVGAIFENGIKKKEAVISQDDKLQIVVTSFPQYDFARAVAKDEADISMLIKPGVESHSYEPTPEDIQKIENADLFIYTGGENDEWVEGMLDSLDTSKTKLVKLEDCVTLIEEDETVGLEGVNKHSHDDHEDSDHEHSSEIEYDEHVWTSPKNAIKIIEKIESVLCELDEEKQETYSKNAQEYISEIDD